MPQKIPKKYKPIMTTACHCFGKKALTISP